ncbi:MAG: lipid-transfer protein [Acidimicrobiia bacterium]|nr:lipid-transfer protein [Acidimicrobiia bacterium]
MSDRDLVVLGVGMHPWGKWGRDFTEYGMVAARAALKDAGIEWKDVEYVAGADTIRNGYPGFIAGSTFAQKLGWTGARVSSNYAACASGAVKNSRHGLNNPYARFRKENAIEDVLNSPIVSDPLRLLDICATSDGAAAMIVTSRAFAEKKLGSLKGVPRIRAVSTATPTYPQTILELPDFATDSSAVVAPPARGFKDSICWSAYEEAGMSPTDMDMAEVYDLSTALELDWYEHLGLCAPGDAEGLLRSGATTIGGRVPVNPSGGLSCFGEAIPAQAIAQVCELTWQLRGQADGRQVEGAKAGITANQGLFGNGSSVIVSI